MFSKSTFGTHNNPFGFSSTNMNPLFNQQSTSLNQPTTSNSFAQNNNSIFRNNTYNDPNNYLFDPQASSKMDVSQNQSTGNFENNISNEQIGTPVKFCASESTESVPKPSGFNQTVNLAYQIITCMKEYEDKSFEELRIEDYTVNRRGPQHGFFNNLPTPFFSSTNATINSSNSLFGQKDVNSVFGRGVGGVNQTNVNFRNTSVKNTKSGILKNSTSFGVNTVTPSASPFNSTQTNNLFGSNTSYNLPFTAPSSTLFGQPTSFSSQAIFGLHKSTGVSQIKTVSFNTSPISNTNPLGIFGQATAQKNNFAFPVPKINTAKTSNFNQPSLKQNQGTLFNPFLNKTTESVFANRQITNSTGGNVLPMAELNSLFKSNASKPITMLNNNIPQINSLGTTVSTSFNMQETAPQLETLSQNQSQINRQQQILFPYGTSTLNNIATIDKKFKELTKPTNPKELNSVLKKLKVDPPSSDDKMTPVQAFRRNEPIFTGLENYDDNLMSNMKIKNNPKRLVVRSSSNKNSYCLNDNVRDSSAENLLNTDTDHLVQETVFDELKSLQKKVSNDYWENKLSSQIFNNIEPTTNSFTNINIPLKLSSGMEKSNEVNIPRTKETHIEVIVEEQTETYSSSTDNTSVDGPVIHPPAGIILTRPEYYTIPSMEDIINYVDMDGACLVQGFTVGRHGYGSVCFPDTFDVSNLNLDEIVHIRHKMIIVYPDDSKKPPIDQGLNRKAQVTLDKVYPNDSITNAVVTNVDDLIRAGYSIRLQKLCEQLECHFIDYKPEIGSWVFKVDHF